MKPPRVTHMEPVRVGHMEPPGYAVIGSLAFRSQIGDLSPGTHSHSEGDAMAGQRCEVTDIREVLRRLRAGDGDRRIARELGLGRNPVARYRRWAQDQGLLAGELPDTGQLAALLRPPERGIRPQAQSTVAP